MNLKEIRELIELVTEKGFTEFEIERQGFRMRVSRAEAVRGPAPLPPVIVSAPVALPVETGSAAIAPPLQPVSEIPTDQAPKAQVEEGDGAGIQVVRSPIVGTFYVAPSPTSDAFVRVGDRVEPDTVVCIIEAMKLMNEIHAEVSGEIVKVLVKNAQAVEYGQPLFEVRTEP